MEIKKEELTGKSAETGSDGGTMTPLRMLISIKQMFYIYKIAFKTLFMGKGKNANNLSILALSISAVRFYSKAFYLTHMAKPARKNPYLLQLRRSILTYILFFPLYYYCRMQIVCGVHLISQGPGTKLQGTSYCSSNDKLERLTFTFIQVLTSSAIHRPDQNNEVITPAFYLPKV